VTAANGIARRRRLDAGWLGLQRLRAAKQRILSRITH